MKITRELLRELIMEELTAEVDGNPYHLDIGTPERRSPRLTGTSWGSTGPSADDALSTDELFALFGAGFDPQEVASLNKSNIADHPRSEEILSILASASG